MVVGVVLVLADNECAVSYAFMYYFFFSLCTHLRIFISLSLFQAPTLAACRTYYVAFESHTFLEVYAVRSQ